MNSITNVLARMSALEQRFQKMFVSRADLQANSAAATKINSNDGSNFSTQLQQVQLAKNNLANTNLAANNLAANNEASLVSNSLLSSSLLSTSAGKAGSMGRSGVEIFSKLTQQGATQNLASINALVQAYGENSTSLKDIKGFIAVAAEKHNLPETLVRAVAKVESNFDEKAVSHKGAMGVMQIMPQTAKELQLDAPFVASKNIDAGAKLLRRLLNNYEGDMAKALAAYNAGETAVGDGGVPNYKETQNYVKKVMELYLEYSGVKK